MNDQFETAELTWRDGQVPVSARFDDPYFSIQNGLAETRHVFLEGNRLAARLVPGFHVAELGFGTGLNLLALWQLWRVHPRQPAIRFTSFEAFPMMAADMAQALAAFPELAGVAERLVDHWGKGLRRFQLDGITAEIVIGDAQDRLSAWDQKADAWFLDGFAPAKNPELWMPELMASVARHTKAGGTFATYTAAGHVRRALSEGGFSVDRVPGFGRKRHMSIGRKMSPDEPE